MIDLNSQENSTSVTGNCAEDTSRAVFGRTFGTGGFNRRTLFEKLIPWVTKGGLAIFDQGLISGSNFLISILLARWLMPDQYGAYALAFGVFLLLSMLYQSLLLEPMAVFGGSAYRECLPGYLGTLLWIHLGIALVIFLVLGVSAAVTRGLGQMGGLPGALAGVTLAAPCILLLWLARRSYYLELSPARAAIGALLYCALVLGGLFVVYRRALLSPFTAFLLMGIGALMSSILLLLRLKSRLRPGTIPPPTSRESWNRHWGYGRWALASCIAGWLPAYIYYPLLSSFSGMAQAGELKALTNLVQPLSQVFAALSMLFLPYAARVQGQEGRHGLASLTLRISMLFVAGTVVYWSFVIPFRELVLKFLYSGRYLGVAYLLPLVALGSILWSAAIGPAIALRAMESPASTFFASCVATVVSLAIGIPATRIFGLRGAVWGMMLSDGGAFVMTIILLRRKLQSSPGHSLGQPLSAVALAHEE